MFVKILIAILIYGIFITNFLIGYFFHVMSLDFSNRKVGTTPHATTSSIFSYVGCNCPYGHLDPTLIFKIFFSKNHCISILL